MERTGDGIRIRDRRVGGNPNSTHIDPTWTVLGPDGIHWNPAHRWQPGTSSWISGQLRSGRNPRRRMLDITCLGDPVDIDVVWRDAAHLRWNSGHILAVHPYTNSPDTTVLVLPDDTLELTGVRDALQRFFATLER